MNELNAAFVDCIGEIALLAHIGWRLASNWLLLTALCLPPIGGTLPSPHLRLTRNQPPVRPYLKREQLNFPLPPPIYRLKTASD